MFDVIGTEVIHSESGRFHSLTAAVLEAAAEAIKESGRARIMALGTLLEPDDIAEMLFVTASNISCTTLDLDFEVE